MHELNISDITCQNICLDQELLLQVEMGPHCILETLRRGAQLQKTALALTKVKLVCNSNGKFFETRMPINSLDQGAISPQNSYLAQNGKVERILKNALIVFL